MAVTVATYNIHDGVGTDGVRDIARISDAIAETGADIVALQEVSGPGDGSSSRQDQFEILARRFGGHAVHGPAVQTDARRYGNLLLSRWPVSAWQVVDLAHPEREPRSAIRATVDTPAGPLRVLTSHFGLSHRERAAQMRLIAGMASEGESAATIILGDFNDWLPLSPVIRYLNRTLGSRHGAVRRLATFPSRLPVLALDRILAAESVRVLNAWVPATPLARTASDHRPLVARIEHADASLAHLEP